MIADQNQRPQICPFHKFGHCKLGEKCEKFHSKRICRDTKCDVQNCINRHPQPCKFFSLNICKFPTSCSYDHKKVDDMNSLRCEVKELRKNYNSLITLKKHQDDIITVLREKVNTLEGGLLSVMRDMKEHDNDNESKKDVSEDLPRRKKRKKVQVLKRSKSMDLVIDDASEDMIVEEYKGVNSLKEIKWDTEEDLNFKEILELEVNVLKMFEAEINETNANMKTRKIDETISNLNMLKDKVVSKNKVLISKIGNDENYVEATGDTIEILGCVERILTRLVNSPKNKFRKAFEEVMEKKMSEEIKDMIKGKQAMYWGLFDETEF